MAKFRFGSPDGTEGDPLTNDILDSALDDVPSSGARDRLLATLDLLPADAGPKQASSGHGILGARYLQVAGLALALGASASVVSLRWPAPNPSNTSNVNTVAVVGNMESAMAPAPREGADVPSAEVTRRAPPSPSADSTPPATEARAENRAKPTARVTPPPSVSQGREASTGASLGREVARVTAARAALATGEVQRALTLLDSYDAEFPDGTLTVEASVLRIEALARSGRRDEARRLGNQFLGRHPRGAFARRVERSLELSSPETVDTPPAH